MATSHESLQGEAQSWAQGPLSLQTAPQPRASPLLPGPCVHFCKKQVRKPSPCRPVFAGCQGSCFWETGSPEHWDLHPTHPASLTWELESLGSSLQGQLRPLPLSAPAALLWLLCLPSAPLALSGWWGQHHARSTGPRGPQCLASTLGRAASHYVRSACVPVPVGACQPVPVPMWGHASLYLDSGECMHIQSCHPMTRPPKKHNLRCLS